VQKHFFRDVTKVENFYEKCLTLLKDIRFGRSKSPVKGLSC
jgi:hypothetical protein